MYLKEHLKFAQENLIFTCSRAWNVALTIFLIYFMCAEGIKNMFHFISFKLESLQLGFYA